jgi:hypothetical protein
VFLDSNEQCQIVMIAETRSEGFGLRKGVARSHAFAKASVRTPSGLFANETMQCVRTVLNLLGDQVPKEIDLVFTCSLTE